MTRLKRLALEYRLAVIFFIITLLMLLVFALVRQPEKHPARATPDNFVKRVGSQLLLKGQPFRFSGTNIYWLGLDENVNGVDYPTHFRVDDALATAQMMGASVVRSHTLGISVGCARCIEPEPGQYNEIALRQVDYAIMSAQQHGLRLIIPLVDNWRYYHGGKHTFTDWRGISDEAAFYSNPDVIADFEGYIRHILERVNSDTGVAYKDDPTILGWETGNGLTAPRKWVETIANFIKSIDPNHLVLDGNSGQSYTSSVFTSDLSLANVDIYTGQYYPLSLSALNTQARAARAAHKVFIAEEYAWNNVGGGDTLQRFLRDIETNYAIAGDLFWSLFGHNDTYGYVQHHDGYTLHYPGDTPDMRRRDSMLRQHAFSMSNLPAPLLALHGAPVITRTLAGLTWRGVAGADTYTIERSKKGPGGPWIMICKRCATDNTLPWIDKSRPKQAVWYRIQAFSLSGIASSYSPLYPV